jgi:hypothetical protein
MRTGADPERAAVFFDQVIPASINPLTIKKMRTRRDKEVAAFQGRAAMGKGREVKRPTSGREVVMKRKTTLAAALCFVLVLVLVLAGWAQAGAPIPPVGASSDALYNVLDPRGIQPVVTLHALAPRLTTLVGKTILFDQGEADPVVMPALWARVTAEHPEVTWKREVSSSFGPSSVESTYYNSATKTPLIDAVIRGNAW